MDSWRPSSPTSQITSKRKTRNDQFPTPEGPKLPTRRGNDSYAPRDDEVFIPREDVASETRKRESYVPADSIPQRRGREQDYGEIEVKRRRTEVDYSPPVRRAVLLEPEVLPTSNFLPQPPATAQDAEVPRAFAAFPVKADHIHSPRSCYIAQVASDSLFPRRVPDLRKLQNYPRHLLPLPKTRLPCDPLRMEEYPMAQVVCTQMSLQDHATRTKGYKVTWLFGRPSLSRDSILPRHQQGLIQMQWISTTRLPPSLKRKEGETKAFPDLLLRHI